MLKIRFIRAWAGIALTLLTTQATYGAGTEIDAGAQSKLIVPIFHSKAVELNRAAARVSVGNPDIADILILRASQLYVIGKDLGTTNVLLWDKNDDLVGKFDVQITHNLEDLKQKMFTLLPDEDIEIFSAERSLVLRGTVSSMAVLDAAMTIADGYLTQVQTSTKAVEFSQDSNSRRADKAVGKVINLLQVGGGQQVMLEVKVAEIERRVLKRLQASFSSMNIRSGEWNWGGVNGGATFPDATFGDQGLRLPIFQDGTTVGPVLDEFLPNEVSIPNQGLFANFLTSTTAFNLAIDAARENGLSKILAEPTLTTLTGEQASFLSGGEFPYLVDNGDRGNTTEFKKFGIQLNFIPVVLGSGRINVKLDVSVSDLVERGFGLAPSLETRSANVTIEVGDGQTMGIAGLIDQDLRQVVTKFPGLGDIPVLGALFRSQSFRNDETELVITVTPRLAKPMSPENIKLPTDGFVEPTDLEFYLLGRTEGKRRTASIQQAEGSTDE